MSFSFVHITDHHLRDSEGLLTRGFSTAHAFRSVLRHVAEHVGDRIDFLVSTGDVVEPPSEAAYENVRAILGARTATAAAPGPLLATTEGLRDFPIYFLPGNHDDRDAFFRQLFPRTPAMRLMNVCFEHDGVQFVCLDWGPSSKAVADPELLDFLDRSLANGAPSVILSHHAVTPVGARWLDSFLADDVDEFWNRVAGRNVLGILSAHLHATYETVVDGIPVFGLRATAFQFALQDEVLLCLEPPHYRLVSIDDGVLTTRIFEVPL